MKKLFVLFLLLSYLNFNVSSQINYLEVAQQVGLSNVSFGSDFMGNGGLSTYDFNNDGWDDISMATSEGDTINFFMNIEGYFEKVTPAFVPNIGQVKQILWADYNNDNNPDLFISSFNTGNHLYKNTGNLNFVDVTLQAGITTDSLESAGAAWGDINNDGWLDLAIANYASFDSTGTLIYLNNGSGGFIDISESANMQDKHKATFCMVFSDLNNDGLQDIYCAVDKLSGNTVYINNGELGFYDVTESSGGGLEMFSMCIAAGDYDNNGTEDFYFTSMPPQGSKLSNCVGDGTFEERATEAGINWQSLGWGALWLDSDLDGDLDLYVNGIGSTENELDISIFYENLDDGTFSEIVGSNIDDDTTRSFSNAIGDFNNDGLPDFVVNNKEYNNLTLWENITNTNNLFIKVDLVGVLSNRDGIGSWIEVDTDSQIQYRYTHCGNGYLAQNMGYELFGLGEYEIIDSIKVRWLSGLVDVLYDVVPNQKITIVEGETITSIGINKKLDQKVNLYPNPANDKINISSIDNQLKIIGVKLYDLQGRIIISSQNDSGNTSDFIDVSALKNGVYQLKILTDKGLVSKKITIVH